MRKWWKVLLLSTFGLVLLGELVLRFWGLRDHPLYATDTRYEYMTLPDQDVHYGRVHFRTNELGLRSAPIRKKRGKRVLVIGDSVVNGGLQTTQDSLATALAQQRTGIELINLSAASWGPDNAMAFLRTHGTFEADAIILVFSSHDAYDRMTFTPIVGVHPSYPDHRPLFAWSIVMDRLLYRAGRGYRPPAERGAFVDGWKALRDTTASLRIPLVVLLHPELGELTMGHYDDRGQRILDSLHAWHVPVIELLDGSDASLYTDRIHLGNAGHQRLAEVLSSVLYATTDTFARAPTTPP
ncbi:MAG: hypothetical protein IPN85_09500 [Flavobacteriales bacterium]|nr:hypothetical protein [Flavobacteriales bacterium]